MNTTDLAMTTGRRLAEAVRAACLREALAAYEDAGIRGLCAEGRWECAVSAIQMLDLEALLATADAAATPAEPPPTA
jgi:hypothetical protein